MSESTLYPVLRRLLKEWYLETIWIRSIREEIVGIIDLAIREERSIRNMCVSGMIFPEKLTAY